MKTIIQQYPALERMAQNGLPVDVPTYLGFAELALIWGVTPSSVRTYASLAVRMGEWRYLPKPDIFLIRDDNSALPGWLPDTIAKFQRLESINGKGYHARGADRKGYNSGAFTKVYRHTLGVGNAEEIRRQYNEGEATMEELADQYGLRVNEVQRVLEGKRWAPGTVGKKRGRMGSPAMEDLGTEKAEEIRRLADDGEASILELAHQYDLHEGEIEDIISGVRWPSDPVTVAP